MFRVIYGNLSNMLRSDVVEKDNNYVVTVELPGYKKEDIKISIADDELTIKATREKGALEGAKYLLKERVYGEVTRTFYLDDMKDDEVKATFVDGLLTVTVPKLTEAETKKIIPIE